VEVGRFSYDFEGEFKFFPPDADGKSRRPSVLVRLTDNEGVQGWGQAVPVPTWTYETTESVESTLVNYLAPDLLGADPSDIAAIHDRMDKAIKPAFSTGQPLCKAAVDLACYDLAGKRQGKQVSEILGGVQREQLTLSWTVNSMDMNVVEQQLEEGRARSYQNFNIKVGYPQDLDYDLALAKKVRNFAPQGFLWADANTGYSIEGALEIMPKLADAGVAVIESPLPPHQIRGYQALKQQGALPIYMDEGIISPAETAEFIHLGMMDGITLKPARSAGLYPSQKIVQLAQENGIALLGSGLTDPDLSLAAALHLYAWIGFENPCALNGPQYLVQSLCDQGDVFIPENGSLKIPNRPGLGIRMDDCAENILSVVAEL
jgi:L-alanine-DL-glutamate epimerase-like enolase superfamily enzyme